MTTAEFLIAFGLGAATAAVWIYALRRKPTECAGGDALHYTSIWVVAGSDDVPTQIELEKPGGVVIRRTMKPGESFDIKPSGPNAGRTASEWAEWNDDAVWERRA